MSTLKRRIAQLFWPIGLFIALVVGCQKDTEVSTNQGSDDQYIDVNGQNVKVLLSKDTKNDFYILNTSLETEGIVLPVGTRIKTVKDDPSSFNFTLLEGYEMIFRGTTVQSANATAGKVTCTCSKGTGCSPFIADLKQNTTGCLMGPGCDECSKKTSARIAAPGGVIDETILEAGVVNLKNEIGFITEREELDKIRSISKLILSSERVQNELRKFASGYQKLNKEELYKAKSVEEMPSNYVMVAVNLYGRSVYIPIDNTMASFLANSLTNAGLVSKARIAAGGTCKCESGTVGFKKGSQTIPFLGSVVYCDASGCKTCSLTT